MGGNATPGGLPAMTSPRQLLLLSAVAMTVIGWQTFRYPPSYLAFADLWGVLAVAVATDSSASVLMC